MSGGGFAGVPLDVEITSPGQPWKVHAGENAAGQKREGSALASSSASPLRSVSDWDVREFSISHCCVPDHLLWLCAYVVNSPAPLRSQL